MQVTITKEGKAIDVSKTAPQQSSFFIEATNVTAGYPSFSVSNVTFKLHGGQILGLVGKSGCGKSTIMKALIGQMTPLSGNFVVQDNGSSKKLRDILGYSPQENSLFPDLTVKENILTFAKLEGVEKSEATRRMNELLKKFDLSYALNTRTSKLSGGMRKRLDITVALIHRPRILVLDEPFTGLDVAMRNFIWKMLKDFAAEDNIVILSSHLLDELGHHCSTYGAIYNKHYFGDASVRESIGHSKIGFTGYFEELFNKQLDRS